MRYSELKEFFLAGGLGQLGIECAKLLRKNFGAESVILSDIIKPSEAVMNSGPYIFADILDFKVRIIIKDNGTVNRSLKIILSSRVCKKSS